MGLSEREATCPHAPGRARRQIARSPLAQPCLRANRKRLPGAQAGRPHEALTANPHGVLPQIGRKCNEFPKTPSTQGFQALANWIFVVQNVHLLRATRISLHFRRFSDTHEAMRGIRTPNGLLRASFPPRTLVAHWARVFAPPSAQKEDGPKAAPFVMDQRVPLVECATLRRGRRNRGSPCGS